MKKEASVPIIIAAVVALVGVIGFMVYKATQPSDVYVPDAKVMRDQMAGSTGRRPEPAAGATGPSNNSANMQQRMMQQYQNGGRQQPPR